MKKGQRILESGMAGSLRGAQGPSLVRHAGLTCLSPVQWNVAETFSKGGFCGIEMHVDVSEEQA